LSQPPRKSTSGPARRGPDRGRAHPRDAARGPSGPPFAGPPRNLTLRPDAYLVPGERAVVELLRAQPARVRRLLALVGRPAGEAEALALALNLVVTRVEHDELATVISPELARGIVAVAAPPREHDIDDLLVLRPTDPDRRRVLVALDGVQDPHNLGALIRSAEFFGALGMFWARDRSAGLSPTVVRSSAGASERLPLGQITNLARALKSCKDAGYWVLGTVADGGSSLKKLAAEGLPDALVVVLGGEENGLRRLTRESCDFLATIPGAGGVASLNVSAAAAVTLSCVA
jgi:23S rRNA (guanosine2251-2'-O)-methyltransferase